MKLHFEPNLDYQMQAIQAVCELFRDQEVCRTESVTMKAPTPVGADLFPGTQPEQLTLSMAESDLAVGNGLTLLSASVSIRLPSTATWQSSSVR